MTKPVLIVNPYRKRLEEPEEAHSVWQVLLILGVIGIIGTLVWGFALYGAWHFLEAVESKLGGLIP